MHSPARASTSETLKRFLYLGAITLFFHNFILLKFRMVQSLKLSTWRRNVQWWQNSFLTLHISLIDDKHGKAVGQSQLSPSFPSHSLLAFLVLNLLS